MAASERSGGSHLRFAQRRCPLLLLLPLLLPGRTALGNEGAAAGSCQCEKYRNEPPLVKRFPHRLVAWERCRSLIRFIFPKNQVCGLDDAPWVLRLISRKAEKHFLFLAKEEGSAKVSSTERRYQPSPTGRAPLQPLSSAGSGSTPVVPMETLPSQQVPRETLPSQWLPALTHTTPAPALESVRSIVLPRNDAMGEIGLPPRVGPEEEDAPGWHQTAVLSVLGVVLLLVIVGLLCWWRPPRRGFRAAPTSEQQVWMLQQRPREGPTCSPRADAASGSGLGGLRGAVPRGVGNVQLWPTLFSGTFSYQ